MQSALTAAAMEAHRRAYIDGRIDPLSICLAIDLHLVASRMFCSPHYPPDDAAVAFHEACAEWWQLNYHSIHRKLPAASAERIARVLAAIMRIVAAEAAPGANVETLPPENTRTSVVAEDVWCVRCDAENIGLTPTGYTVAVTWHRAGSVFSMEGRTIPYRTPEGFLLENWDDRTVLIRGLPA